MRIGYYHARSREFRGNCITNAGRAMLLWERSAAVEFNPGPFDGARVVTFDDGVVLRQLIIQDFFVEDGEVIFHNVDGEVFEIHCDDND